MQENYIKLIESGRILTEIAAAAYDNMKVGADIVDIARAADKAVIARGGSRAALFAPTTVEINKYVHNFSPLAPYKLTRDDVASVTVSINHPAPQAYDLSYCKADQLPVKLARARSISGLHNDTIGILEEAADAAIKNSGPDVRLYELSGTIHEILRSGAVATVTNVSGYCLNNIWKAVPNTIQPDPEVKRRCLLDSRMEPGEVYFFDIYGTDKAYDCAAKRERYPTILYRTDEKRTLRLKSTRTVLSAITRQYGTQHFSMREFYDQWKIDNPLRTKNSDREKLLENALRRLTNAGLIAGIPVGYIAPEVSAMNVSMHVGHTIVIRDDNEKKIRLT